MERKRQTTRRALQREGGFTLTELLIASTLLLVALTVMGTVIVAVLRNQSRLTERSTQIQNGRAMIERLTRELREGSDVQATPTASSLTFRTFVRKQACGGEGSTDPSAPAIQCQVTYTCSAGTCQRTELPGGAVTMVEGLNSDAVFGYSPSISEPRHVSVTLEYPAEGGGESVTLSDGASLRNPPTG